MQHIGHLKLTDEELQQLSALIYKHTGIVIDDEKRSLIINRLQKDVAAHGFSSYYEYYKKILEDKSGFMLSRLIDRISTNFTYFWRESDHFVYLKKVVLPEITKKLEKKGRHDLRIWCAAAATGEEPYTIVMVLKEFLGFRAHEWKHDILATDISSVALEKARKGVYQKDSIEKLPRELWKYFKQVSDDSVEVREEIRRQVLYRRFNLMNKVFPFKGKFQVIFCRNVLIYFDPQTRAQLADRFYQIMEPGGYLFLGHTETIGRNNPHFRYVQPAVYQRV